MNKKYTAIIIGAGRISSGFDSPVSKEVLTHAHALVKNSSIKFLGFFDINKSIAKKAALKWGVDFFESLDDVCRLRPDIIIISTPDELHYKTLLEVVKFNPKIVICEKPITTNVKDTEKIIKIYNKLKIPIAINYSRRFDTSVQLLRKEIENGKHGKVIGAVGIYVKGLLHNGSHMVDLARYLFGNIKDIQVNHCLNSSIDNDKNVNGFFQLDNCPQFHLMTGDEKRFTVFELRIFFEKRCINFFDSGFQSTVQAVVDSKRYRGYKVLGKSKVKKTNLGNAIPVLLENVINKLNNKNELVCTATDAYHTQKSCFAMFNKCKI